MYDEVEIPKEMRGDPLHNPALAELDCPRGACRIAASETYRLVQALYRASVRQNFLIHPRSVLRAYGMVRERQPLYARNFSLLHVLLRGIYAQLWRERNEDLGPDYRILCGTNQLLDETIQWWHAQQHNRRNL